MSTVQLIAGAILIAGLAYFFLSGDGATPAKGKHGMAMLKAGQQAGLYGAAVVIEERLGKAEANRFLKNFAEGAAEPAPAAPSPNA